MTKRNRKIAQFRRNEMAEFYQGLIESDVDAIRRVLRELTALAAYNAEMEDCEVRASDADDMQKSIEIRLEVITETVKDLTRLIKGGWKVTDYWKIPGPEYEVTEDTFEEMLAHMKEDAQGTELTDEEIAEIREAETMEIVCDPNEDPPMTEEEEREYEERIDSYLAQLDDYDIEDEEEPRKDIDPAYDHRYWIR